MRFFHVITSLFFALTLARIDPSACQVVKGKVTCIDCTQDYDFSGIKVSMKCEGMENMAVATTENDGSFMVDLSTYHTKPVSDNCHVKLLGGPSNLYASRKNQFSQIVKDKEENSYTTSTTLSFFTSCPQNTECTDENNQFGSSKTYNFPMPSQWGLAPTSFYLPFFPIIGIP
ncbi:uncharacterized protein LOC127083281 [Lathyrus oleraceus]|uniref:Pollen Ole e 1 allergen and extensin family protein n=1 Tax=Pisum sativum TaxID=3888 RepID=A0A9D4X310_PEA|nr:uncharacterized protein LOC127083281 [Pisum sativum]KAI5412472.1 hypothetical protein KIW84_057227 [Pisum sativum]